MSNIEIVNAGSCESVRRDIWDATRGLEVVVSTIGTVREALSGLSRFTQLAGKAGLMLVGFKEDGNRREDLIQSILKQWGLDKACSIVQAVNSTAGNVYGDSLPYLKMISGDLSLLRKLRHALMISRVQIDVEVCYSPCDGIYTPNEARAFIFDSHPARLVDVWEMLKPVRARYEGIRFSMHTLEAFIRADDMCGGTMKMDETLRTVPLGDYPKLPPLPER